jgi:5'-phosphate synthase pdxT subunit
MDIEVERNSYGRQIDSAVAELYPEPEFEKRTGPGKLEAVFIRAPRVRRAGPQTKVLARYQGDPVLVEDGAHLVATFHPELTTDPRVHSLFLEKL